MHHKFNEIISKEITLYFFVNNFNYLINQYAFKRPGNAYTILQQLQQQTNSSLIPTMNDKPVITQFFANYKLICDQFLHYVQHYGSMKSYITPYFKPNLYVKEEKIEASYHGFNITVECKKRLYTFIHSTVKNSQYLNFILFIICIRIEIQRVKLPNKITINDKFFENNPDIVQLIDNIKKNNMRVVEFNM